MDLQSIGMEEGISNPHFKPRWIANQPELSHEEKAFNCFRCFLIFLCFLFHFHFHHKSHKAATYGWFSSLLKEGNRA